jgi:hypothetical protein
MQADKKPIAETLPDLNLIVRDELVGMGAFGRVFLTLDFCDSKFVRHTISREKSVRVEASHA